MHVTPSRIDFRPLAVKLYTVAESIGRRGDPFTRASSEVSVDAGLVMLL